MEYEFSPPKRPGLFIQGGVILILAVVGGYFFFLATRDISGLDFLWHMLIALIAFLPLPFLVYRLYGLLNAVYILRRDGLLIRWGLRREDFPLNQIEWIRPATELGFRLPMPWLRLPGGILGSRRVSELGLVEFLAANVKQMILVATQEKIYAISPGEQNRFMKIYRQVNELGSLTTIEAQSVYPKVLFGRVWENRAARLMILVGFGFGVVLFLVVALAVPGFDTIQWLEPGTTAPAERLLLLPILYGIVWLINLILGIFLYRKGDDLRIAAYLLWTAAALTGVLLLVSSLLIIY